MKAVDKNPFGRDRRDAVYMTRSEDAVLIRQNYGSYRLFFDHAAPILKGNIVSSNRLSMVLNGYPANDREVAALDSAVRLYIKQPQKVAREMLEDVQKNGTCLRPLRPDEVMALARALLPPDEVSGE